MRQPRKCRVNLATVGLFLSAALIFDPTTPASWAQEPDLESERGVPVYARQRPEVDPLGVRAGAFMIYPQARLTGNFDDNIYATPNNRESDFITTIAPRIRAESNWSNHHLALDAEVAAGFYAKNQSEDFVDGRLALEGRLDVQRGTFLEAGLSVARLHEERGDPDVPFAYDEPSVFYETHASLTGYHGVGRLSLSLGANYTRLAYRSVDLTDGTSYSQSDRDRNIYEGHARVAYELLPNVIPFIQGSYNVRRYDTRQPINRESEGYRIGVGSGFDAGGIITGEVYAGYMRQNYVSSRLDDASGPWFGAQVLWNVTRLTSVELGLERRVVETANLDASSYTRTAVETRVDHELLRNLLIGGYAHYYDDRYNGTSLKNRYFEAGPRATYLWNRNFNAELSLSHSRRDSNDSDLDYRSNRILFSIVAEL
ncbi:MAG TPA: outer membrane beta-barrel protein [Kiloniellales bacterium]|nr:outer membrane beta-barrel protein [Kiloniellales bacterium]